MYISNIPVDLLFLHLHALVFEIFVEDHHCGHCLHDRYGSRQDAGVVASLGFQHSGVASGVYGLLLHEECGYGLEGYAEDDVLTV